MASRKGSSPLTRGKPTPPRLRARRRGLIPAHAGKTPRGHSGLVDKRAHPRSRGENGGVHCLRRREEGSSPLTRGKLHQTVEWNHSIGLIPAHAGKTMRPGLSPREGGAHPRSRGENITKTPAGVRIRGSSPLTRGKPGRTGARAVTRRLIPAHAGKTPARSRNNATGPAHPRSRGENSPPGGATVSSEGSSPLTRGKRKRISRKIDNSRAHPRSRGENTRPASIDGWSMGSSPLTRGKRDRAARIMCA